MAYPTLGQFSTFGYENVYIPGYQGDGESQKRFIVGFTLNEEGFALNNYVTVVGSDKPIAYYQKWKSEDFVRVAHADGVDERWADGSDRPTAPETARFTFIPYELRRYGTHTFLGDMAEQFSDIGSLIPPIQEQFASRFMVRRSIAVQTALTTSGNYPSATTHYYAKYGVLANAASSLGYPTGYFGTAGTQTIYDGTLDDPFIKKTINHAVTLILRRSNGTIKPSDLLLVVNPNTAARLSATREIRSYLAQQSGSLEVLKGQTPSMWPTFGLPNPLYGLKVMVDATTKVTAKVDHVNDDSQDWVVADDTIEIVARPGSVAAMSGSRPYSSVVLFQHKKWAMKPETFPDPENHRLKVAFSDMFTAELVAPEITFTIQAVDDPATS